MSDISKQLDDTARRATSQAETIQALAARVKELEAQLQGEYDRGYDDGTEFGMDVARPI